MLVSALCLFSLACVAEGNLKNTCTDISFYDLIKYTDKSSKCCDTVLKEVCEDKRERVCRDITDFKCNTEAWAECSSTFYQAHGKKCELKYNDFEYKHCQETEHFETQIKMVPECKDVTKQSCVDIWETDHHGNKRFVENKCTPVTWEECKLVEKEVQFPTFQTNCKTESIFKWADFVQGTVNVREMTQECEVKSSVNCVPHARKDCVDVKFTQCKLKAVDNCSSRPVWEPTQEKVHKEKCLH